MSKVSIFYSSPNGSRSLCLFPYRSLSAADAPKTSQYLDTILKAFSSRTRCLPLSSSPAIGPKVIILTGPNRSSVSTAGRSWHNKSGSGGYVRTPRRERAYWRRDNVRPTVNIAARSAVRAPRAAAPRPTGHSRRSGRCRRTRVFLHALRMTRTLRRVNHGALARATDA